MNTSSASTLDTVMYMASLVSERRAIDPIMDKVRDITSQLKPGHAPSAADDKELQKVRAELAVYLTEQDPIRLFSIEELETRVKARVQDAGKRRLRTALFASWSFTFLAFFVPFLFLYNQPPMSRMLLSFPFFFVAIHVSIIWFYWSALKDFRPALRRAYVFICLGIFIIGLNAIQLPLIFNFGLGELPWFRYGAFMAPFPVACFLLYYGMKLYGELVGVRVWFTDWRLVGGASVVLAVIAVLLPHYVAHPTEEVFFDLSAVSSMLTLLYLVLLAIVTLRVWHSVTPVYNEALKWFFWMAVILAFTTFEYTVVMFFRGELTGVVQMITMLPFIFSEFCKLQSGYVFKRSSKY
jgi:hypothetical protein